MSQRIWVQVKPQAKITKLTVATDGTYQASVHAAPHDGQANQALIELLAGHFSRPKSKITILRGLASRKKLVEIG